MPKLPEVSISGNMIFTRSFLIATLLRKQSDSFKGENNMCSLKRIGVWRVRHTADSDCI